MKIALLGCDSISLRFANAARQSPAHQLIGVYGAGPGEDMSPLAEITDCHADWESLLVGLADVVIVAAPQRLASPLADWRLSQLRVLLTSGVPMVVVHPFGELLAVLEAEMVRHANAAVLQPYYPGSGHPAVARLREMLSADGQGPLGTVQQIQLERPVGPSRDAILGQLAQDVSLLRDLVGEIHSVTSLPAGSPDNSLANLAVGMSTHAELALRWTAIHPATGGDACLHVLGSQRSARLDLPVDESQWVLQLDGESGERYAYPRWDGVTAALERLDSASDDDGVRAGWLDVCHDLEVAQAAIESHERQRTIEITSPRPTPQRAFRGLMALAAISLLGWTLLVLLAVAMAEGLNLPISQHALWQMWPFFLLVPLAVFLAVQWMGRSIDKGRLSKR